MRFIANQVLLNDIDNRTNLVSHFALRSMRNNASVWTNQNALEFIEREYNALCDERVACNFFPAASQAYLEDVGGPDASHLRFSSIVGVAYGVGLLRDGEHKLMLQRRCAGTVNDPWNGDARMPFAFEPHSAPDLSLVRRS